MGDPRRERPPAVYGHVVNVPTHLNVKIPAIGGHLPNADADSHLLVVRTCYNGQCKQMPRFCGHFNPKSFTARTLSCYPQFVQMSILPSGDRMQYFISRLNACMMNHVIVAVSRFGYICFTTSRRKSHVEEENDSSSVYTLTILPDARTVSERFASGCPCTHCVHCVGFVRYTQTTSGCVRSGSERFASAWLCSVNARVDASDITTSVRVK